jgi:tyrosine-specific transport protein
MEKAISTFSSRVLSGTMMIAGVTIGAGMFGIPLVTAAAGFWPAMMVTILCWLFMMTTGFLVLDASLKMPEGTNIFSMAGYFLGNRGRWLAGGVFLSLYICLMVAYFAGGAPILGAFLGVKGAWSYLLFGAVVGGIVFLGMKIIDRVNIVLTGAKIVLYFLLVGLGSREVSFERLEPCAWSLSWAALPILFSAFGYHNVIPSLRTYLQSDRKALRLSIVLGTAIPLVVYSVWQWLIIGAIPGQALREALARGETATAALQAVSSNPWLFPMGQTFAFLAMTTAMMCVSMSLVDFLKDALRPVKRSLLCVAVFMLPGLFALLNPTIFDRALGFAGGFGEAFLNGLLPIAFAWVGRDRPKAVLVFLFLMGVSVMALEVFNF